MDEKEEGDDDDDDDDDDDEEEEYALGGIAGVVFAVVGGVLRFVGEPTDGPSTPRQWACRSSQDNSRMSGTRAAARCSPYSSARLTPMGAGPE